MSSCRASEVRGGVFITHINYTQFPIGSNRNFNGKENKYEWGSKVAEWLAM